MGDTIRFTPASSLSLESFATLFTRSFEHYFYPITLTAASFATRLRVEQLDLHHSVVLVLNDTPVGQATLGLRGDKAWCGGFGIVPEQRGKHLAAALLNEFIKQAREAGAKNLVLEVLQANDVAQRLYAKAGLRPHRDMLLLEWKHNPSQPKRNLTGIQPVTCPRSSQTFTVCIPFFRPGHAIYLALPCSVTYCNLTIANRANSKATCCLPLKATSCESTT